MFCVEDPPAVSRSRVMADFPQPLCLVFFSFIYLFFKSLHTGRTYFTSTFPLAFSSSLCPFSPHPLLTAEWITHPSFLSSSLRPRVFIHPLSRFYVRLWKRSTFCPPTFLCIGCMVYSEHMAITALPVPRNQGPERGLFVLRQKNFADMFFFVVESRDGIQF